MEGEMRRMQNRKDRGCQVRKYQRPEAPKMRSKTMAIRLQNIWVVALLANICSALWGSAYPCVKTGYKWLAITSASDQIVFAGIRFLLAGLQLFFVYLLLNRRVCRLKKELTVPVIRLAFVQTVIQYFFFYIGMSNTAGVKGSIINAANGFFVILAAHFLTRDDKLNGRKIAGCLCGLLGVVVVNLGGDFGGGMKLNGEGFILLSSAAYGVSSLMAKKLSRNEDPLAITCYNFFFGGSALLLLGFILGGKIPAFDGKSLLLLFYMGIISAGAFSLWTLLLKYNPAGRVAIFSFETPFYGCLFSGLFLGEEFLRPGNLAALILVCLGILIVNYQDPRGQRL